MRWFVTVIPRKVLEFRIIFGSARVKANSDDILKHSFVHQIFKFFSGIASDTGIRFYGLDHTSRFLVLGLFGT